MVVKDSRSDEDRTVCEYTINSRYYLLTSTRLQSWLGSLSLTRHNNMTSTVPILGVCILVDTLTQDPESSVLRKNRFSRVHSFCRVESPESSACSGQVCSESFGEGIAHHKLSLGQIAHHLYLPSARRHMEPTHTTFPSRRENMVWPLADLGSAAFALASGELVPPRFFLPSLPALRSHDSHPRLATCGPLF
jgi:hypothetical protein